MKLAHQTLNQLAEFPARLLPPRLARSFSGRLFQWCYQLMGQHSLDTTTKAVQLLLSEPGKDARSIAIACFAAKGRQRCNYRAMTRTTSWPEAHLRFPPRIFRLIADTSQPMVLLTLHQADYLAGLLAVLRLIPVEREIHIIKLASWTQIEQDAYAHFRKRGHRLVIHRLSDRPAKRIVRALKNNAILLTFVDVPREFGSTIGVELFGLPFQLTSGPLAIARLAGACVLPVFTNYEPTGACEIRTGGVIGERKASLQPSVAPTVADMGQELACQIEVNLRRYPAQWEMWPVIHNLLDREALSVKSSDLPPATLARLNHLTRSSQHNANAQLNFRQLQET